MAVPITKRLVGCLVLCGSTLSGARALAAPPCPDSLVVEGNAPSVVETVEALGTRGIGPVSNTPDCSILHAVVEERPSGGLDVTLKLGAGTTRWLATPADTATWLASWVGEGRYADLLAPPAPAASASNEVAPVEAAGLVTPVGVALFATFEDLRAGRATGRVEAGLRPLREAAAVGLPLVVSVDLKVHEAKALGRVVAVAEGSDVYVDPEGSRPGRAHTFGRLERVGDTGLFPQQVCYWVSTGTGGHIQCELRVYRLDLVSGVAERVTWPRLERWLEAKGLTVPDDRPKGLRGLWGLAVDGLRAAGER